MTIRRRAQHWARSHNVSIDGDMRTSKYYPPEESRSGRAAWWVEIPLAKLCSVVKFDVFCEKGIEIDDFRHLAIPAAYLRNSIKSLYTTNDKISMWLSAEASDLFRDTHPDAGNADFGQFAVADDL